MKSASGVYHVMIRGINKEKVFNTTKDKERIYQLMVEKMCDLELEIYAYCVMNNHMHLLIKAELNELATFMSKISVSYAQYYNLKKTRVGHVFQNRYKSECIITEDYFWNCLRYIHLNPVKANCITNPIKYKYSSYKEFFNTELNIVHHNILDLLENRFISIREFKRFHMKQNLNIFLDIEEDSLKNLNEIAFFIISDIQKKLQFSKSDLIENTLIRQQIKSELILQLNIDKNTAEKLIEGTVPYLLIF